MLVLEVEREADGRWIAAAPAHPGVQTYGDSPEEALCAALRLLKSLWPSERGDCNCCKDLGSL